MSDDTIRIQINVPGNPPEVLEDVYSYALITIPKTDPDNNTNYSGNMQPKALAMAGMWLISLGRWLMNGQKGDSPTFGQISESEKSALFMPGRDGVDPVAPRKFGPGI